MATTSRPKGEEDDPSQILREYECVSRFLPVNDFQVVTDQYPFAATAYYLSLARPDRADPIMKQLCPSLQELIKSDVTSLDPLSEEAASPVPGLVHRYPDRALMILTNVCFMNCRHCTRKRLWKKGRHTYSLTAIEKMLTYISEHVEIRDVILSGGDPLTLSDDWLENILQRLRRIKHVEIIRLGSRAPVVYPLRITPKLVSVLKRYRPLWFNTQFNHFQEITEESARAISLILEAGIPVNNQTVLLRGINDDALVMKRLCHGLLKIGVRPYYLFHCDPVIGVEHFRTSISRGLKIIEQMRGHTSGLAVPVYVVDAVRGGGKIPLQPKYLLQHHDNSLVLRNYQGEHFIYEDRTDI